MAYLQTGKGADAVVEFKKIADHPYYDPLSVEYPLAILEMARAHAQGKDFIHARVDYQRLLDLWKGADPDFPLLQTAKQEFSSVSAPLPAGEARPARRGRLGAAG